MDDDPTIGTLLSPRSKASPVISTANAEDSERAQEGNRHNSQEVKRKVGDDVLLPPGRAALTRVHASPHAVSDSEEEQETFAQTGADASKTQPIRAGEVKKGKVVLLKGFPCKVIEMTTSKTGKHGHAKANITGIDIFTGKKYEEISPTSHNMEAPVVSTTMYMLTDISEDGFATLLNEDTGETREDLMAPNQDSPNPDLGVQIRKHLEDGKDVHVTVTKAMDTECITSFRTN